MFERAVIHTKFGFFEIKGSQKGVRSVRKLEEEGPFTEDLPEVLRPCAQQLNAYFAGKRKKFDLPLDLSDTPEFNRKVWSVLRSVPYGHTISYAEIAHRVGSPKGYQAVGLANKHNPIAIIIPCHRCVGKDGSLTGYFYGLEMKRALLQLENPMSFAIQGRLF